MPHSSIWAVQSVEPDAYIGKEITHEIFIVKNHPLSKTYRYKIGLSRKVEERVFIFIGEIIGGTSFPVGNGLVGAPYSIDGKTAEEVINGDYADGINNGMRSMGNEYITCCQFKAAFLQSSTL